MASVLQKIGTNIERARKMRSLSQQQLAEKARLDLTTISEIESGLRNTSIITVNKIASALDITLRKLFDF